MAQICDKLQIIEDLFCAIVLSYGGDRLCTGCMKDIDTETDRIRMLQI